MKIELSLNIDELNFGMIYEVLSVYNLNINKMIRHRFLFYLKYIH